MWVIAYFSSVGVPATGLSPTLRIRDLSDDSLVVTDSEMDEVGDGFYKYDFDAYDKDKDYSVRCDGTDTLADSDRYTYGSNEMFDDVLDDIKTETDKIQPDIIASPSDYMADVSALAIEGNVETHVTNSINSYDPPTRTELTTDKEEIIAEIDANETKIDAVKVDTVSIEDKIDDVYDNTDDIESKIDISIADIAAVKGDTATIKSKTDNLPVDPASETNVNANETKIDTIDTVVDVIKTKTDNLPTDPTSETNATTNKNSIISEVEDINVSGVSVEMRRTQEA